MDVFRHNLVEFFLENAYSNLDIFFKICYTYSNG